MSTPKARAYIKILSKARAYIKILSGCEVVVNLSNTAYEAFHQLSTFLETVVVEDFSDALVIGNEVDRQKTNVQLTSRGIETLVRAGVLPSVERLKILQGYSGIAVAVSAAQGVGYIYGILVRIVQGRHVSPIEAIGFYLSVIKLIKATCHYFTSSCHRPLLLFLNPEMETKFIDKCREPETGPSLRANSKSFTALELIIFIGVIVIFPGVVVFFIIIIRKSTLLMMVMPLIILLIAILPVVLLFLTSALCGYKGVISDVSTLFLLSIGPLGHAAAYVYALFLIVRYWKSLAFNIDTTGYLSEFLPYIG